MEVGTMRSRHIFLTLVFIVGLLLAACSNDSQELETQPKQEIVDSIEQGQTLNIVTPPKTDNTPEKKEQYQIQTRLVDFHLLNETTGLAWGVTRKSLRLYLTEDLGKTWINISPAANVQFTSDPEYGTDVFFLDKNNGWIIRNGLGLNETVVLRTTNGGQQWKISSLPKSTKIKGMSFSSLERGWIITSTSTSLGQEEKYLYRTDDGGANWNKIMQNTGVIISPTDTMGSISYAGSLLNMTFVDFLHGFVTLQENRVSELYTTADGGNTWNKITNFIDIDKMGACSTLTLGNPQFVGQSSSFGFLPLSCSTSSGTKLNGYFTTNKGQSWELSPFNLKWSQGVNQNLSPVFVSHTEGWYLQESLLYHTNDQGTTWKALPKSELLQDYMVTYPIVVRIDFVSSDVGWILLENSYDKRSLLLQTKNGGVSWEVL
jgi:photosystem II stability/assembly factor-like uncharacterized protein